MKYKNVINYIIKYTFKLWKKHTESTKYCKYRLFLLSLGEVL